MLVVLLLWLVLVAAKPADALPAWYACPLLTSTGIHCPGCGTTRAASALLRGDPLLSVRQNPLFILLGIPAVAAILWRDAAVKPAISKPIARRWVGHLGWIVLVLVTGFWLARNVPIQMFEVLRPIDLETAPAPDTDATRISTDRVQIRPRPRA